MSFCFHEFEAEVIISSMFSLHWHIDLNNMEFPCVLLGRVHCMQQLLSHSKASSCCSFCAGMWLGNSTIHFVFQESAGGVKHRWEDWWTAQGMQHILFAGIKLRCKTCVPWAHHVHFWVRTMSCEEQWLTFGKDVLWSASTLRKGLN